jgi:hypothetical protein
MMIPFVVPIKKSVNQTCLLDWIGLPTTWTCGIARNLRAVMSSMTSTRKRKSCCLSKKEQASTWGLSRPQVLVCPFFDARLSLFLLRRLFSKRVVEGKEKESPKKKKTRKRQENSSNRRLVSAKTNTVAQQAGCFSECHGSTRCYTWC